MDPEPVSVISVYDAEKRVVRPLRIKWRSRVYPVKQIGMHYTEMIHGILHHIWSVYPGGILMILKLNTSTLHWTVEATEDIEKSA